MKQGGIKVVFLKGIHIYKVCGGEYALIILSRLF